MDFSRADSSLMVFSGMPTSISLRLGRVSPVVSSGWSIGPGRDGQHGGVPRSQVLAQLSRTSVAARSPRLMLRKCSAM